MYVCMFECMYICMFVCRQVRWWTQRVVQYALRRGQVHTPSHPRTYPCLTHTRTCLRLHASIHAINHIADFNYPSEAFENTPLSDRRKYGYTYIQNSYEYCNITMSNTQVSIGTELDDKFRGLAEWLFLFGVFVCLHTHVMLCICAPVNNDSVHTHLCLKKKIIAVHFSEKNLSAVFFDRYGMSTVCPELFGFTIGPSGCRNSQCVKEVICANLFYLHYARAYTHTNTNNKFVLLTLYTCTHTHTYHLQALLNLLPVWRTVDITATHDALTVSHTDEVSSPWKLSDTWQFWKVFT